MGLHRSQLRAGAQAPRATSCISSPWPAWRPFATLWSSVDSTRATPSPAFREHPREAPLSRLLLPLLIGLLPELQVCSKPCSRNLGTQRTWDLTNRKLPLQLFLCRS